MPKPKTPKKTGEPKPNYKQLRDELDSVLAELQREDLDVDQALAHYQRGLELIQQLEKQLSVADNKVRDIKGKFDTK